MTCADGPCFDAAFCVETRSGVECTCPAGYEGDGFDCTYKPPSWYGLQIAISIAIVVPIVVAIGVSRAVALWIIE